MMNLSSGCMFLRSIISNCFGFPKRKNELKFNPVEINFNIKANSLQKREQYEELKRQPLRKLCKEKIDNIKYCIILNETEHF
jgi:hypothetical protein